ncbi:MAG: VOC family protein, partial [Bacteroidota bacterium]
CEEAVISRVALKTKNIKQAANAIKNIQSKQGQIIQGTRETSKQQILQWTMSKPLAEPLVDTIPFYIDWSSSAVHPCDNLDHHCTLKSLIIYSRIAEKIKSLYQHEMFQIYKADSDKIVLEILTPKGLIQIK